MKQKGMRLLTALLLVSTLLMAASCDGLLGGYVPPVHTHDWGAWETTTEPTCTETGERTHVCSLDASHTETEEIAALGHNWGAWMTTTEPACTKAGEQTRVCSLNAQHTEKKSVSALGHDWGAWTVTTAPTESAKGVETRVCKRDGSHAEQNDLAKLPPSGIPQEFQDAFYEPASWYNFNNKSTDTSANGDGNIDRAHKPVPMSDGSLAFVETNQMYDAFLLTETDGIGGNIGTAYDDNPYIYAFMLHAPSDFNLLFLATAGVKADLSGGNWIGLSYQDGNFAIRSSTGGATANLAIADGSVYTPGEWTRVDLRFVRVKNRVTMRVSLNSTHLIFKDANLPNVSAYGHGMQKHTNALLTDGDFSFGAGSVAAQSLSGPNYGTRFAVRNGRMQKTDGVVRLAPYARAASLKSFAVAKEGTAFASEKFNPAAWTRASGDTKGLTAPVTHANGLYFNPASNASNLVTSVPYSASQHMTFRLKTTTIGDVDGFKIRFRASSNSSGANVYYEIAHQYGRLTFGKSGQDWQAVSAANQFRQDDTFNQMDLVVTDGSGKTTIDLYINGQKALFVRHNGSETNFDFTDGSIVDKSAPIQSGNWFQLRLSAYRRTFMAPVEAEAEANHQFAQSDFIGISQDKATIEGKQTHYFRKNKGSGAEVVLRGTNAGGWLVIEPWMNAFTNEAMDQKTTTEKFTQRFGKEGALALWQYYRDNFWTEEDFKNCADIGMTVLRLPFSYMTVDPAYNNVRAIPGQAYNFEILDWFVSTAEKYGIYTILDLHSAYGSQNGQDHSGQVISNANDVVFFREGGEEYRAKTTALWSAVAEHFKGNPAVAAYDILNEPGEKGGLTQARHWDYFSELYTAIRAKDSDHVIMIETCWDAWNLPVPSARGWTNVSFSFHHYTQYDTNNTHQVSFKNKLDNNEGYMRDTWGGSVPAKNMGEFCCYDSEADWDYTLKLMNDRRWSWTSWSYKAKNYDGWGMFYYRGQDVNPNTDSYESIIEKWRKLRTNHCDTEVYRFANGNTLYNAMQKGCTNNYV